MKKLARALRALPILTALSVCLSAQGAMATSDGVAVLHYPQGACAEIVSHTYGTVEQNEMKVHSVDILCRDADGAYRAFNTSWREKISHFPPKGREGGPFRFDFIAKDIGHLVAFDTK